MTNAKIRGADVSSTLAVTRSDAVVMSFQMNTAASQLPLPTDFSSASQANAARSPSARKCSIFADKASNGDRRPSASWRARLVEGGKESCRSVLQVGCCGTRRFCILCYRVNI
jgi:hypothetical protein